ncbi:MAG: Trk system potassium transporter TrkA [bacterium]|nr:Trk system potassium transporter TrkA [bacterium]
MQKVLICGAGQVGSSIARYLSHYDTSVTVVDQNPDLVADLSNALDVKAICGFASHPEILERAGAADADVLIAVTRSDEVNIVACEVAHALFEVPTKIARIRSETYLRPQWDSLFQENKISLDAIIAPEAEVARSVGKSLAYPGASSAVDFFGGALVIISFLCTTTTPVVNTPIDHISHLYPDFKGRVVAIKRGEDFLLPDGKEKMLQGDQIFVATAQSETAETCEVFASEHYKFQKVLIIGGGNVGFSLAQEIESHYPDVSLRIIEKDRARAEFLAHHLTHAEVLNGDAMDRDLLEEAGIQGTDIAISVTAEDKANILSALLSKNRGALRAFSLINDPTYNSLVMSLGVDAVIPPRATTVARILEYVRQSWIVAAHPLKEGECEFLEVEVPEGSTLIGRGLDTLESKGDVLLCAMMRNGEILPFEARKKVLFQAFDRLTFTARSVAIPKLERLFSRGV